MIANHRNRKQLPTVAQSALRSSSNNNNSSRKSVCNFLLFVVVSVFVLHPQPAHSFTTNTHSRRELGKQPKSSFSAVLTNSKNTGRVVLQSSTENNEAQDILDKVAKLRAEIAQMEGKSVEDVEQEANDKKERERLVETERAAAAAKKQKSDIPNRDVGANLEVPNTADEMVKQASRAVERAFQDGITRQTVRFALIEPESQYIISSDTNEWPGGAQQMYRRAGKPLTTALLREIHAPTKTNGNEQPPMRGLPPTIVEQDIWDFDGSALHTAESKQGPSGDVQALVFPNTDMKYINDIETIHKAMGDRLVLLINPFWRNLESWGFNILAPNAKKRAQEVIFDNGFQTETYSLLRFSARGEDCVALKVYPYDWQLFAYYEEEYGRQQIGLTPIRLGSCKEEPTSSLMTELINARPEFKETKTMRQMKKMF